MMRGATLHAEVRESGCSRDDAPLAAPDVSVRHSLLSRPCSYKTSKRAYTPASETRTNTVAHATEHPIR